MKLSWLQLLLLAFSLFTHAFAAKKPYIIYLGGHSHGVDASDVEFARATDSHYDLLGSHLGSIDKAKEAIFYSYNKHINGFAAMLDEEEAEALSKNSNVVSVFLSKSVQLHTTRSWDFLGLEKNGILPGDSLWRKARFGEDTIIGNLDTGVWPESASFSDAGMGPIPSKWKGICQKGSKNDVACNRKLIGARYFSKGFKAAAAENNLTYDSTIVDTPRDADGHGTHTLSTAGGSFVPKASVFGFGEGTAKGGSPKARVAAYRVCLSELPELECMDTDIMAAFDQAIHDGVDVLSVSLGGDPSSYVQDGIAIASFHAFQKGVVVVCSAGNSGPAESTVSNLAPWILTVGASTMDREFQAQVILGNNKNLKGQSLSTDTLLRGKFYPLVNAAEANAANASSLNSTLCMPGTLDPKKVKGKILVCMRGNNARVDKGNQAKKAGAVAMILANDVSTGDGIVADAHLLPVSHITYTDGLAVFQYINSTESPVATVTPVDTKLNTKPAPVMASFSSQGPNLVTPEILKPDITAPGVSVIAAYTEETSPTELDTDKRRTPFNSVSGTSMSCPHISGVVGLLKTLHPDWSPAAIKSAIMTTAKIQDNVREPLLNGSHVRATAFSYGAGHVSPNHAADPGLVYDSSTHDYLNFLCALGYNETQMGMFTNSTHKCSKSFSILDLNYPSITVPNLSGSVTVKRTVKNVGSPGTYRLYINEPRGISVTVLPRKLEFKKIGEVKSFKVSLKVNSQHASKDYVFGSLTWSDGIHRVRSPLVVKA